MTKTILQFAATSALVLASPSLFAHAGEDHGPAQGPNGGQLQVAGAFRYELVVVKDSKEAKDNPVIVFLTDKEGKKTSTAGASGTATILAGKAKATATLAPDGDNRLKGIAKYPSAPDMKVVVSITVPGQAAEQARFTPLTVAKDVHSDRKH